MQMWVDTNKFDLHNVGCLVMNWINVAKDRDTWWALANVVTNLWFP